MSAGARLRAIMADHGRRGPEYAVVECIGGDFTCPATERVDGSAGMTDAQIVAVLAERGWSVRPTLCPKHAPRTAPRRIQMTRQRPWRAEHPDAVIVARPSRWGNPYRVADEGRAEAVALFRGMILGDWGGEHDYPLIHELAGRDLACWCPLDQPCHADVLLELANPKETPRD